MLPHLEFYVDAEVAELFLRFQNRVFQKLALPNVGIIEIAITSDRQQPPSTSHKSPQAPDGLSNIDTLRGGVSVELATSNIVLYQRKLGSCRNLASYLGGSGQQGIPRMSLRWRWGLL
jgi:hypothetical protein